VQTPAVPEPVEAAVATAVVKADAPRKAAVPTPASTPTDAKQKAAASAATPAPAAAAATPSGGGVTTAAVPSAAPSAAAESASPDSTVEEISIAVIKKRNEQFSKIWKMVNTHEKSEPFKKPVTKREAPDYHTVIKRPMAINDVKKRVDKSDYEGNFAEFFGDMHLIFSNAMQYNTKNSEIWSWAKELQVIVKKEEIAITGASASDMVASELAPAPKTAGRTGAVKKGTDTPEAGEEPKAKRARGGTGRGGAEEEEEEEETKAETKGARSRRQSAVQTTSRKRRREDD